jgi:hypothetical protein
MNDIVNEDRLAEAIVLKAVSDYRNALRGFGYYGKSPKFVIKECEKFFRSDWFGTLYHNLDGEIIIKFLQEEYESENRNRKNGKSETVDTIFK